MNAPINPHEFNVRLDWADRINAAWQKSVAGILEVGRLLIAAKAELRHGDFKAMFEAGEVKFSIRTAEYLMDIGRDERLTNTKYISHLPPAWSVLKELTKVADDVFEAAVDDGLIHPDMSCADAKNLKRKKEAPQLDLAKQYLRMFKVMSDVRDALASDERNGEADNLEKALALLAGDAKEFEAEIEQRKAKADKLYVAELDTDGHAGSSAFVAKNLKDARDQAQTRYGTTRQKVREATADEHEKFK